MTDGQTSPTGTGWYPDPMRRAALREWSVAGWTSSVSDGRTVWIDPRPVRRFLDRSDLGALRFIEHVYLPEAHARGAVTADAQLALLAELTAEAQHPAPTAGAAGAARFEPQRAASRPASPRPTPLQRAPLRPAPAPSAAARWFTQARASAGSDLAVNGLAYLGVLLLFTGVFGLVAFAFGDVTPGLRPVAELACAAVPFAAARQLLRHGAAVAGRALEVVGGLLLPVMLITSAVDGFAVPPDLRGGALAASLALGCAVAALAYAAWVRAHPASGLRFAVGPALWFAVAAATLGAGRPVPSGQGVAVPTSWQVAAVAGAVVGTLVVARRWPGGPLAAGALRSCIPGTAVVAVLAALTGAAQGLPADPVGAAGALVLCALVLLRGHVPAAALDVAAPAWWALVVLALVPGLAPGPLAVLAAAGFLVLLELAGWRGRSAPDQLVIRAVVLVLPAAGLLGAVLAVWTQPRWAAPALAVLTAWAVARRTRPYRARGAARALDVAAAALPAGAVVALALATSAPAGLVAAAALVAVATVPATRPVWGRGPADTFWLTWWRGGAAAVALAALALASVATSGAQLWAAAGALLAVAGAAVAGPLRSAARPWIVVGLTAGSWLLACEAGALPEAARGIALGAGAVAAVAAAHSRNLFRGRGSRGALGLAGHVTAIASLGLAGPGWALVAVLGLALAGFAITAVRADSDRSPVGAALAAAGGPAPYLPWTAVAVAVPALALASLEAADVLAPTDPWAPAVLAATALLYAGSTRARLAPRCGGTLAWAGFAAALLAVAGSWQPWPAVVALGALIGSAGLLAPARRAAPMRWAAWAGIAPFLGVALDRLAPGFRALPDALEAAATLTVVGGALLIAAAGLDLRGGAWVPRWRPRRAELLAPASLGAGELAGALLLAAGGPAPGVGLIAAGVAAALLLVGALARAGILAGVAVAVGWLAVLRLSGAEVGENPLVAVAAAAAILTGAQALSTLTTDRGWWSRWDAGVLVAAAPVALTALAAAADGDQLAWTFTLIGLQTCAVAVRLRARSGLAEALGWSGTALVLAGAGAAGPGWLALALVALAAVHAGLAVRASGDLRVVRQLTGAVAAVSAWVCALQWLPWSGQVAVDASAAGFGALALAAAGLARAGWLDRSWVASWGGAAALVSAFAAAASVTGTPAAPSAWVGLGLAGLCAAFAAAAGPLRAPWLRDLSVGAGLAALLAALRVLDAPAATTATVLAGLASLLAALTLAQAQRDGAGRWNRPWIELGAASAAAAIGIGLAALPESRILVPAVAAAAVQVAAAGVARRSVGLQVLSPVLACAAWLLFVADAVRGGPQWYAMPIGLSLLVIAAIWRRDLRQRQADPARAEVVAIELAGIAFGVGASLVQAVTQSVAHALLAVAVGIAVAAWGVLSQVRRRVAAGVVVVLASLVVAVVVPLVALLPGWGGAGLWILIAVAGLIAVVATTLIERGRSAVGAARGHLGEATAGWE